MKGFLIRDLRLAGVLLAVCLIFLCAAPLVAAPAPPPPTTHPSGNVVIQYLNDTIDWYRRVQSLEQSSGDSQETLLRASMTQNARKVVQLAFQFANAEVSIIESEARSSGGATNSKSRSIQEASAQATQRASQIEAKLHELDPQIAKASGNELDLLYARRYELTSELNLANTQRDVLAEYAMFMTSTDTGDAVALRERIDELQRSVPETQPGKSTAASATTPAASNTQIFQPENAGIFRLISEMFHLSSRMSDVKQLATDADKLHDTNEKLRGPMRDEAVSTYQISQAAASATQPTTQDSIALEKHGIEIDRITDRFKALSSASIPLAEQATMLEASRDGLKDWHSAIDRQYDRSLRALALRLGTLVGIIVIIFVISELWKRGTFRYIHDPRRQRQFMVVRRITVGAVVVIIIIASVVSEFGSLATFAGLITAGVAVALQTVILSGVAYFFFIGRFGVRVGDRVTISNITGDVIEIGLFRIYLMEMSGEKPDLHPTGRIVVFSNSVLFQPSAFYKQLPGSDYIWHEIAMTLSPNSDYKLAEQRLLGAVNNVFKDYKESVEQQHDQIERSLHVQMGRPHPEGRLRLIGKGLEFVVRYPVDIRNAAQIDDRITRELLKALNEEPKLEVVSGTPTIRPA